jgi:excinuclease ABC subunit A
MQCTDGGPIDMLDRIVIRGAREHNLKNINLDIPRGMLTVVTGVSGSGKSTLAFDTLYAEGQRRYIESLSTYAKQFLERIGRPDVDEVLGISPSIAIQQKNTTRSSRSTVGTSTEIYDYLRLLFARVGRTECPDCNRVVARHQPDEAAADMLSEHAGQSFLVVASHPFEKGVSIKRHFEELVRDGYSRILLGGEVVKLDPPPKRRIGRSKSLELVLDRLEMTEERLTRIHEAVELAYKIGDGFVRFVPVDGDESRSVRYTLHPVCVECGRRFEEPRPILFSFNTPYGACPHCRGFGNRMEFDEKLIVPDPRRSIRGYAIEPWASEKFEYYFDQLTRFCRRRKIALDKPWSELPDNARRLVMDGDGEYVGVLPFLENLREKSYKKYARFFTRKYMTFRECRQCGGGRLREAAYYVKLGGVDIREVASMTPDRALAFVSGLELDQRERQIAKDVLVEIESRLRFMLDVGLHYVTLDRLTKTLSGGEAQRISLANSLGANLRDVLYVLDEPSIGLHPRDTGNLVKVLVELRSRGNTVVVVEHDMDIIRRADHIVDMGPGAGERGGEIVYQGPVDGGDKGRSKTLRYVRSGIPAPGRRSDAGRGRKRTAKAAVDEVVGLRGVREHNLKNVDVDFPLGAFTCVTGVSGSGKSTLVCDVLYNALRTDAEHRFHDYREVIGRDRIANVMMVDQSPIGKTPRSNPTTYIKAFAMIREIFASQRRAVKRGYKSGRFSFNVAGGRCPRCQGMGYERVEMHFMADLFVRCSECEGKRFNHETLEITYRGLDLSEVLELTVDDALEHFGDHEALVERLRVLSKVGLGYIRLGQPSTTLSGGESQRIKIARELAENTEGGNVYILDEPTTGLHVDDVATLIVVLRELMEKGNSIIVVEHNPQVILQADHIVDLGPEGGDDGGRVVAVGSPLQISRVKESHTGAYLRKIMRGSRKGKK